MNCWTTSDWLSIHHKTSRLMKSQWMTRRQLANRQLVGHQRVHLTHVSANANEKGSVRESVSDSRYANPFSRVAVVVVRTLLGGDVTKRHHWWRWRGVNSPDCPPQLQLL